ncbi:putative lyase [Micromonospora sp. MW-13]|uniref:VOC family protein n=1 Tax=unclassified Micromonospora TaxID=2617518 RepID=UPI000E44F0A2|nr:MULTISPECIES: VOC family protein [unclassified Micromonospora]MCX4472645.1 VOC family protein [Micromonospora sp. NBC_01655]RGC69335.1 putative lyase [Micromonospora sp. MW-13]
MVVAGFSGIHHIALNVCDLDASVRWYGDVLGFSLLFPWDTDSFDRRLMRHPSGVVIGLTTHKHADAGTGFNERRTGLDHLAFAVPTRAELETWASRLTDAGVAHSGITVTPATGFTLIAFRDPDNIQLEMYLAEDAPDR